MSTDSSLRNSVERKRLTDSSWREESEQGRTSFKNGRKKGMVVGECVLSIEKKHRHCRGQDRWAGPTSRDGEGALGHRVGAWRAQSSDRTEAEHTGTDTDQWRSICQGHMEGRVESHRLGNH